MKTIQRKMMIRTQDSFTLEDLRNFVRDTSAWPDEAELTLYGPVRKDGVDQYDDAIVIEQTSVRHDDA